MKTCSNCKIAKNENLFSRDKGKKDGLSVHCKECARKRTREWVIANKDRAIENGKNYYRKNKVELLSQMLHVKNPAMNRERVAQWKKDNPSKVNATCMRRHAAKLHRTPPWLTDLHHQQIQLFYDAAVALTKEFGIPMEVDHIIPLQGENISGLHVPWNLQVIPAVDNAKKSNRI